MGESLGIANFILNQPHELITENMKIQFLKKYIFKNLRPQVS